MPKRGSAVVTVDDLIGSRRDDDEPLIDCEISVGRSRTRRVKNNPSSSKKAAASVVASKAAPSSSKTDSIRYSSLCQKLEQLSKKLHDVDDEIGHDAPNSKAFAAFGIQIVTVIRFCMPVATKSKALDFH